MIAPETTEGYIGHNGARIHYTSTGEGVALVCVHAGSARGAFFSPRGQAINAFLQEIPSTANPDRTSTR